MVVNVVNPVEVTTVTGGMHICCGGHVPVTVVTRAIAETAAPVVVNLGVEASRSILAEVWPMLGHGRRRELSAKNPPTAARKVRLGFALRICLGKPLDSSS